MVTLSEASIAQRAAGGTTPFRHTDMEQPVPAQSAATPITQLDTPALLLDRATMDRNIARMRDKIASLGVALRPHVKTVKCLEAIERIAPGRGAVTVSTLREAEELAAAGYRDILYAVGITPQKVPRVQALRRRGVDLKVIVDNHEVAAAVCAGGFDTSDPIPTLIEIDTDGHRAGVRPDDAALLGTIAGGIGGALRLGGLLTHAGGSYECRSIEALKASAAQERDGIARAAAILRETGHRLDIISIGSTPSVLFSENMTGVTEARAGVFAFFDLVMAGIGVCTPQDIALSVLATVISAQADRGRILVDAGWMAMSRDRGTARQPIDQGYGMVCDLHGTPYPDLIMIDANQEHGVLGLRSGSAAAFPDLHVGDQVRILPNHACATASQHDAYQVTDEARGAIMHVWPRFGGW